MNVEIILVVKFPSPVSTSIINLPRKYPLPVYVYDIVYTIIESNFHTDYILIELS